MKFDKAEKGIGSSRRKYFQTTLSGLFQFQTQDI